jgi:thiosulfate/3-mercaptopyruvate sulfurtransferase
MQILSSNPVIGADALLARIGEPGLLIVDVRGAPQFGAGTVPGAVNLNVYDYFIPSSSAAGVADLNAAAVAALSAIGADRANTVVYFEGQTGMISPRGLWFHEYAGLGGGLILDGGFQGWREAGGATAPGAGTPCAVASGAAQMPWAAGIRRDLLATVSDVLALDPERQTLLDVRRRSEHDGAFVHPCCARPGRIPGAAFLLWEDLLEHGRYRPANEIAARAGAVGLRRERELVIYCHRGARAATALYGLRRAGFARARIFVGSWHEWAETAHLPAEVGGTAG